MHILQDTVAWAFQVFREIDRHTVLGIFIRGRGGGHVLRNGNDETVNREECAAATFAGGGTK